MAHEHDPSQQAHPDDPRRRSAAVISLAVGILMLVGKWSAYGLTGSQAILSDALESVVHVAATAFALLSLIVASRPPDPKYPYGYGKIGYFSAGFEGALIAIAALLIVYEAIQGFLLGEPLKQLSVGFLLILAASVINLGLGLWLVRRGRETDSLILVADGQHVLTDSWTSFGVVAGIGLVMATGWNWLDPTIALLVGLNILRTGFGLVREAFSGLMDRADPELLSRIVATLQAGRSPGWLDLHQLRAWQAGDRTFVDFHLIVPRDWSVVQLHETLERARALLRDELGTTTEPIIHFDPEPPGRHGLDRSAWSLESAVRLPTGDDPATELDPTSSLAPAEKTSTRDVF